MRNTVFVMIAFSPLLIGLGAGESAAQPIGNEKSAPPNSNAGNSGNPDNSKAPVARQPQRAQQPFYCFGDAACEREMARQGRPVADPRRPQDKNEGPFIQGIPGQTEVPGFSDTPVPVVPGN
jgi:hypothetical protein